MQITNRVDDKAIVLDKFEIDSSVEELEEILAPTPSIPIPPPFR
jgi:hypothetical protein